MTWPENEHCCCFCFKSTGSIHLKDGLIDWLIDWLKLCFIETIDYLKYFKLDLLIIYELEVSILINLMNVIIKNFKVVRFLDLSLIIKKKNFNWNSKFIIQLLNWSLPSNSNNLSLISYLIKNSFYSYNFYFLIKQNSFKQSENNKTRR